MTQPVFGTCAHCRHRMLTNHDANGRPRLYCSDKCRQRACRARHKTIAGASRLAMLHASKASAPTARTGQGASRSVETQRASGSNQSTTTAAKATPKRALTS